MMNQTEKILNQIIEITQRIPDRHYGAEEFLYDIECLCWKELKIIKDTLG